MTQRILVLGDTHIHNHQSMGGEFTNGINARCQDILNCIETAVEEVKPDAVVQLGDFFDNAKPTPAVYYAAMQLLQRTKVPWHILAGNHDISSFGAPTAVRPLAQLANVHVYEQPCKADILGYSFLMLPYCSLSSVQAVAEAKRQVPNWSRMSGVFAHYGLASAMHTGPEYIEPNEFGLIPVFCGHEHTKYQHGTAKLNVGSFTSLYFGATNDYTQGGSVTIEVKSPYYQTTFLPSPYIGPVFLGDHYPELGLFTFARATNIYVCTPASRAHKYKALKDKGMITDYKITRDQTSVAEATPQASIELAPMDTYVSRLIEQDLKSGNITEKEAKALMSALENVG